MRRPSVARCAVLAAALLGPLLVACGDDDGARGSGLPAVEGTIAPEAYRVVYEVTTPEGRGRDELVVHRPFGSSRTERGVDGEVVTQRIAARGLVVTVAGGEATALETAIAPAADDLRLDRFADRLVAAGRLQRGDDGQVGGRPCRRLVEPDAVATDGTGGADRVPVRIERCVDAQGIVLEERITTIGGQAVRTRRAVELDLGDDVPAIDRPDVEPLPPEQGGGQVEDLEDVEGSTEIVVGWRIRVPEGWARVGSYVVQPAAVADGAGGAGTAALVTEVWRRGPDLLLLDQGRTLGGATPFDPATAVEDLQLEGVGPATLAVEPRLAEVRFAGTEGGFIRVAGTLPIDELVAVAATLERTAGP